MSVVYEKSQPSFNIVTLTKLRNGIMASLIEAGFVELTQPDSPRSPTQKYRLTEKGRALLKEFEQE